MVDDHAIVRQGMKQILSDSTDMVVADEASTGQEAIEKVRKKNYDVVVLDISMPDGSGLQILKELKSVKPKISVLILSIHPEEEYAVRSLREGASGYLTKASAPNELIAAIREVSQGRKYVTSSLAEKLAHELSRDYEKSPHERLSDRELEVLCMIASGKHIKEIAKEMHLSPYTVRTYRSRILQKMGVKTNVDLTRYAMKHGLIE